MKASRQRTINAVRYPREKEENEGCKMPLVEDGNGDTWNQRQAQDGQQVGWIPP